MEDMEFKLFFLGGAYQQSRQLLILPLAGEILPPLLCPPPSSPPGTIAPPPQVKLFVTLN